jgi:hypothetical protein
MSHPLKALGCWFSFTAPKLTTLHLKKLSVTQHRRSLVLLSHLGQ